MESLVNCVPNLNSYRMSQPSNCRGRERTSTLNGLRAVKAPDFTSNATNRFSVVENKSVTHVITTSHTAAFREYGIGSGKVTKRGIAGYKWVTEAFPEKNLTAYRHVDAAFFHGKEGLVYLLKGDVYSSYKHTGPGN